MSETKIRTGWTKKDRERHVRWVNSELDRIVKEDEGRQTPQKEGLPPQAKRRRVQRL